MARVVREAVNDAITNHLNDPRIEGFVSITHVSLTPDMRVADVYLSIFSKDEKTSMRTYNAIVHATRRIQSLLASKWHSRYCPTLQFHLDENFKKTLETMRIIDEVSKEHKHAEQQQENQEDQDQDKDNDQQ